MRGNEKIGISRAVCGHNVVGPGIFTAFLPWCPKGWRLLTEHWTAILMHFYLGVLRVVGSWQSAWPHLAPPPKITPKVTLVTN